MALYLYQKIKAKRQEKAGGFADVELSQQEGPFTSTSMEGKNSNDPLTSAGPTAPTRTPEEKRAARIYRAKIVLGLAFPFAVQGLDTTIIASALGTISSEFNQLGQINWIVSAYNLTAATFIFSFAQFADIFGRYAALQGALFCMLVGSTLCAAAPTSSFPMLLFGRAFQGMGSAGILILTKIILADKVSLKENAKNNTIFTLVGGISYAVGPVVGGYLTSVSWRWCFLINLPVVVIGIIMTHFVLRKELLGPQTIYGHGESFDVSKSARFTARLATVDFGGQFLFLSGMSLLVLALTWAGASYPWNDYRVLITLVLGGVITLIFLLWEYLMLPGKLLAQKFPSQKPMIPLRLVWTRNSGLLMYINFITGMAMYAVFYFVELYFSFVLDYSTKDAGVNLLYYTPGLGIGAYLAMYFCNVKPRQTWHPLFLGTVIEPLGITLLAIGLHKGGNPFIFAMLAVTGVGTGIRMMPGTLHGVGYYPDHISSIVSLMSFAISFGGTFSMTVMFNIFNNRMAGAGVSLAGSSSSFSAIGNLSPDQQTHVKHVARSAIVVAFFAISAFMWLGILATCAMGNVRISAQMVGNDDDKPQQHAAAGVANEVGASVTRGSYLGELWANRRRK